MDRDIRIVFMGTPDFAVASLKALLDEKLNVVAVVTAPDKPAGRGLQLQSSAVKRFAFERGLKILQPDKLKSPEFLEQLKKLNPDLQVVVAFRMLPEIIWSLPPMGTINVHGSLLPKYRGAAPINWAIINGEKETGVTTFKLKHEIDTGNILLQETIPINENETAGELHDVMMNVGAHLLVKTISRLIAGTLKEIAQSQITDAPHAPKIFTEQCKITWQQQIDSIHNIIRGLSPFPGAFTSFNNKIVKIYRSEKEKMFPSIEPGQYLTDKKTYLKFAGTDGYIHVKELQLEGKKKMKIDEFLRGYRFE